MTSASSHYDLLPNSRDYGTSAKYGDTIANPLRYAFENSVENQWHIMRNELPVYIWQKFRSPQVVGKVSVSNHMSIPDSAKEVHVVASDDCANWTVLLIVADAFFTHSGQSRSWIIPSENRIAFFSYGLRIVSVNSGQAVMLKNTQLWKVTY